MHHIRVNYILIIKTVCRETKTEVPKKLDSYSDYAVLSFLNKLLSKYDCLNLSKEELELELN